MVRSTLGSIKNLLLKEQNEIISAVSMLMVLSLVTKITGMVFLTLVARQFGASTETDKFYLASVVPEMITNIILLGAISGAIIPIFVKLREDKGDAEFLKSFSSTMNTAMLAFVVLSIAAALFSRELVPFAINLSGGGALDDPETINEVVWMMRVMLIPQIILGISAFISTSLNIYQRFIIPQLAPLFFNLGKIAGVLLIVPLMDGSVWGLIWGSLLGSVLHLLVQLPLVWHLRLRFHIFLVNFKDRHFREALKLGAPRVVSLSVEQIASVIDSVIAIGLVRGSLTVYQLGVRLISIPLTLFGTTYSVAAFPTLSKLYAQGKHEEFGLLMNKILQQLFFLTIPVTVLLFVLRIPIVRLVYGILGGNFTWEDTLQVAWVVLFFSLGLAFETMRSALFRAYYAMHNSIIPLISSVLVVTVGIVTGVLFTNYFSHFDQFTLRMLYWDPELFLTKGDGAAGVGGLALSSSLVFTLEFFFLVIVLVMKGTLRPLRPFVIQTGKKFLAGLVMLILSYAMLKLWDEILNTARTLQLTVLTTTTIASSFMLYLWISFVLGVPEVELFVNYIARLLRRLKRPRSSQAVVQ
ncbi:MAG: putative peptidoglycan biosynthesis protein MurJ [candidate division WS6 bacterium OLB20]|uniref:Putative peptidoglycan biosynthesis protein MurJ n=1 Tax=candidate division WS6 bacterium OLB20 TaxID=1617426 RepID=A0A136LVU9_9BACT|nr:MAG: putative peptidoglycan biosynthesis protein MurJ [candidate division WS6 bacterium OLB20]